MKVTVASPDKIAFRYNMSTDEWLDRVAMQKLGIPWESFVRDCGPVYPAIKRTRLKERGASK